MNFQESLNWTNRPHSDSPPPSRYYLHIYMVHSVVPRILNIHENENSISSWKHLYVRVSDSKDSPGYHQSCCGSQFSREARLFTSAFRCRVYDRQSFHCGRVRFAVTDACARVSERFRGIMIAESSQLRVLVTVLHFAWEMERQRWRGSGNTSERRCCSTVSAGAVQFEDFGLCGLRRRSIFIGQRGFATIEVNTITV